MDIEVIESIGINNLHPVFGRGLRGETLAAARNRRFVNDLVAAGVRVVIDLRTADHNDKLMKGCEVLGLTYHHFPIDSHVQADEEVAQSLTELFDLLDRGGFYISCQQGKHRTDIALALYYFFHNDAEIPLMHGHRKDGVFRCAEHAYQAHKFPVGSEARVKLMAQETGSDVKSLASYLSSEMCSGWDEQRKVSVMRSILHAKYSQHPEFADIYRRVRYLELIHESRSDLFWGRKRNGDSVRSIRYVRW